jgi:uracil permease
MNNTSLIYGVQDKPKTLKEWMGYTAQFVLSVLPATMLISLICQTPISAGLISAGLGTLVFLLITRFKVSAITSNSGATVAAIVSTLTLTDAVHKNFLGVVLGGLTMCIIYAIAAFFVKQYGTNWISKLFNPLISGTSVLIIGITLTSFIPVYAQVEGQYSLLGVGIAFFVVLITCLIGHYAKGIWKTLPFLGGTLAGYLLCIILSLCGVSNLVDFSQFQNMSILSIPDLTFTHLNFTTFHWETLPQIILMFGIVSLSAMAEHIADINTIGVVTGTDTISQLPRTLLGDGLSSFVGSLTGSQCTTTFSEATGTIAVSGVASVWCFLAASLTLIALGFITPFNRAVAAMPNCVFAGISILCYSLIANAGVRTIMNNNIDFSNMKNSLIFAAMLSCGVSGIAINYGTFSFSGVALAIIVGLILNLILKDKSSN